MQVHGWGWISTHNEKLLEMILLRFSNNKILNIRKRERRNSLKSSSIKKTKKITFNPKRLFQNYPILHNDPDMMHFLANSYFHECTMRNFQTFSYIILKRKWVFQLFWSYRNIDLNHCKHQFIFIMLFSTESFQKFNIHLIEKGKPETSTQIIKTVALYFHSQLRACTC